MLLIEEHCAEEADRHLTRNAVLGYYLSDLELDLAEYGEQLNGTKHFPRFCTIFVAQQKVKGIFTSIHPSNGLRANKLA